MKIRKKVINYDDKEQLILIKENLNVKMKIFARLANLTPIKVIIQNNISPRFVGSSNKNSPFTIFVSGRTQSDLIYNLAHEFSHYLLNEIYYKNRSQKMIRLFNRLELATTDKDMRYFAFQMKGKLNILHDYFDIEFCVKYFSKKGYNIFPNQLKNHEKEEVLELIKNIKKHNEKNEKLKSMTKIEVLRSDLEDMFKNSFKREAPGEGNLCLSDHLSLNNFREDKNIDLLYLLNKDAKPSKATNTYQLPKGLKKIMNDFSKPPSDFLLLCYSNKLLRADVIENNPQDLKIYDEFWKFLLVDKEPKVKKKKGPKKIEIFVSMFGTNINTVAISIIPSINTINQEFMNQLELSYKQKISKDKRIKQSFLGRPTNKSLININLLRPPMEEELNRDKTVNQIDTSEIDFDLKNIILILEPYYYLPLMENNDIFNRFVEKITERFLYYKKKNSKTELIYLGVYGESYQTNLFSINSLSQAYEESSMLYNHKFMKTYISKSIKSMKNMLKSYCKELPYKPVIYTEFEFLMQEKLKNVESISLFKNAFRYLSKNFQVSTNTKFNEIFILDDSEIEISLYTD